ncbi:hypothetical protein SO802_011053 [Lithocarpus litseifolius]|uniref:Protein kinase domain-containing protein n=1 Tax=Lithocarpus litseifolius TaxID=425828 RepID=A0AAW2DGI0_9ROSI
MQNGSLENHLLGSKSLKHNEFYWIKVWKGWSAVQPLPWDIRLKIAIGAAWGLAFLHTSDMQVIHRNFKSSNICKLFTFPTFMHTHFSLCEPTSHN